ncbi:MAG: hypothetical protein LHV68_03405 [Elusimicrobia bacterium]|nr:hypothetical protein [Candidatus Liberimonas magnetica]
MIKRSFLYSSPSIYNILVRLLYGINFNSRYEAIAEIIPEGVSVMEVCCGDCYLYLNYLKKKKVKYTGLDINTSFIKSALERGVNVKYIDLNKGLLPNAQYVIMQASLYQFIPNHKAIVDKLLDSALEKLIIAEPVMNLSDSQNPVISYIAKRAADPGTGNALNRFNEQSLTVFFRSYGDRFKRSFKIKGMREMVGIIDKQA